MQHESNLKLFGNVYWTFIVWFILSAVAYSEPSPFARGKLWIQWDERFYQQSPKNRDQSIAFPTRSNEFNTLLQKYQATLKPQFTHDPISLKNPTFFSNQLHLHYIVYFANDIPVQQVLHDFSKVKEIKQIGPIPRYDAFYIPNDYGLSGRSMWGFDSVHAPQAWDLQQGDSTVLAVTIDTGVDFNHPDLIQNIKINALEDLNGNGLWDAADNNGIDNDNNGYIDDVIGWDFVSVSASEIDSVATGEDYGPPDNTPMDVHGHGTHVCGSIAARTNNGVGVPAVSFNVKTLCLRSGFAWWNTSQNRLAGSGYADDFVPAIQYAVNRGARIISISFGGSSTYPPYQNAINFARANNCLVMAAAGNSNAQTLTYPAAYDSVMAVAALNTGNVKASFSNYGTWVDISAPGVGIWSTMVVNTYNPNPYVAWQGTSMASPTAASVAALILSRRPAMSDDVLETILRSTAGNLNPYNPSYQNLLGAGIVDAYAGVLAVQTRPIIVSVPNGGEVWNVGSTYTVQWSAFAEVNNVRIELNRNYPNGIWETLFASTPNDGSEPWTVNGVPSSTARIRILNAANTTMGDTSNANFTILQPAFLGFNPTSLNVTLRGNSSSDTLTQNLTVTNIGSVPLTAIITPQAGRAVSYLHSNQTGGPTYQWVSTAGGFAGPTGDDQIGTYPLPFVFPFLGHRFSQITVCTNGWLSFDNLDSSYANEPLPSNQFNTLLAVFWDDLLVQSPGNIQILNDAPNQRYVIAWNNVRRWAQSSTNFTFQAILYANGTIDFQYATLNYGSNPAYSATIGIQSFDRQLTSQVLHNTQVTSNWAIRFTQTQPFAYPSAALLSLNALESVAFPILFSGNGRAMDQVYQGNILFTGNFTNSPLTLPIQLTLQTPIPPSSPQNVGITYVGSMLSLQWSAVTTDTLGNALPQPPQYRIESNINPYSISNWNSEAMTMDTTITIPVSTNRQYFRVKAVVP
ncbi:MAG: S8 family serine peptidase [bacterium]|nr:S8 family serine peptidase [bacterium]